jgi:DnaJ-domain-containing protein 1
MNVPAMAASDDPFAMLGLPRACDIDRSALQAAYLRRSAALHPDRFADPIERDEAQRRAAVLNDAHAVLADDEQRANLLLSILGGPAKEQDKSLPDGFLRDILESRQEMETAIAGGESGERARIEQLANERRQQHIDAVREMFHAPGSRPGAAALAAIRRELNAWRYIERMIEQLRDA